MKRRRIALLCFCLCLCLLLSACKTPETPEDPSAPEESETVSAVEDPNALDVRADLEELFAEDWQGEEPALYWLTSERAEAIRERVKQLKTPVLTEEDVMRISEKAACAVAVAMEQSKPLEIPACGLLAAAEWSPSTPYRSYEDCFRALMGYTLYLFTPPDYLFREDEVGYRLDLSAGAMRLYLPLAGAYTSRSEALALLREGKNGLELPLTGIGEDERPLHAFNFLLPVLLCGEGGEMTFDLYDLLLHGGISLPESLRVVFSEAYVQDWITYLSHSFAISFVGFYEPYQFPDGVWGNVLLPFPFAEAQELRDAAERLPGPVLTEETVCELLFAMYLRAELSEPLLLPGVDGEQDTVLWPGEEDPVWLANRVTAYLVRFFTPSSYRFEGRDDLPGDCYALRQTAWEYEDPEDALWDFNKGFSRLLWVDDGLLFFLDREGNAVPPEEELPYDLTD